MRQIDVKQITQTVKEAVMQANISLPPDIIQALQEASDKESSPSARRFLKIILENTELAVQENMALCQDTGMVVVDVELGQEVIIQGGYLNEAINLGIREGYQQGFFRKSVVNDPFQRINTGDNTPAIVHCNLAEGDKLRITVLPKGAGSENMGQLSMLKPAQGINGVKDFILKVVRDAGGNPCPPIIAGVGVGGNMEKAALLAKRALLRPVNIRNSRNDLARLEEEMLKAVNELGIGPQGMGGNTTALAVNIEVYPTHIASLPVAVNLGCHSTRRVSVEI
ncbi:MAG: fumarate hydratase [Syntrophomonadaceae bacterium]|nr:fumarate hydratase [Syntrophomonadaceae bacterium]MDD3024292.1 fumarate hydratase [Syntrophomonadaceae bacterium]